MEYFEDVYLNVWVAAAPQVEHHGGETSTEEFETDVYVDPDEAEGAKHDERDELCWLVPE